MPDEPTFAVHRVGFGFEIYDLWTHQRQNTLNFLQPIGEQAHLCLPSVYMDDGVWILTGSTVGKVRLWHSTTQTHMQTFRHIGALLMGPKASKAL